MANTKNSLDYLQLIQQYYTEIDAGRISEILKLFSPYAKYNRTGEPLLVGWDAISNFFKNGRKLEGTHTISKQQIQQSGQLNIVSTRGVFTGTNNGTTVSLGFKDVWHFPENRPFANYRRSVITWSK